MEKYICDKCGHIAFKLENTKNKKCIICQGKLISEKDMKEKEEIAKLTDNDKDDDLTPKQDAMNEEVNLIIIKSMEENMKKMGNNKLYQRIESLSDAGQRARYRQCFLIIGGQIPVGERITI